MTKQEQYFVRDNYFSGWCREKLPDSKTGFLVSDIDFILYDYSLKKIMLIETKCRNAEIKKWQASIFNNIHKWISNGIDNDWEYLGFHSLIFENTNFNDGIVYFDKKPISEERLIKILSFGKAKTQEEIFEESINNLIV